MKSTFGRLFAGALLCLILGVFAGPAGAQTLAYSHKHHHHKAGAKTAPSERVRTAQIWLNDLSYDAGLADGIPGPRTRAALASFARDRDMIPNGKLTDKIFDMLKNEAEAAQAVAKATATPLAREDFFASHPDFYSYYNSNYSNPTMLNSPQAIPTRFGDMQITETRTGLTRAYAITLKGQQVFHVENQPSAIDASRTFILGDSDIIILTSYGADSVCPYRHALLIVQANGSNIREIANCTRAYQAYTGNGSLLIAFPGRHVDGWSSGDMWRYENGRLDRL